MKAVITLLVAGTVAFGLIGCESEPVKAPAAPAGQTNEAKAGDNKGAKGMSPDSLTVPGDGNGNFGSKAPK